MAMCAGCVLPYYSGILRNTSALPVAVRIEHDAEYITERGATFYRDGLEVRNNKLPYLPKLLPINAGRYDETKDSLSVASTPSTLEFELPALSAVRLGHFRGLDGLHRLTLTRAGGAVEVLDSTAIAQRVQVKGYSIGLDI
jgi:hypothetical protein